MKTTLFLLMGLNLLTITAWAVGKVPSSQPEDCAALLAGKLMTLSHLAISTDPKAAAQAKAELREKLGLDDLNAEYFLALFSAHQSPKAKEPLWIFENGKAAPAASQVAYPTAIAPKALKSALPAVRYQELASSSKNYAEHAKKALIWIKKMQAGSGSSMTRTSFLARVLGVPASQITIGAKGTDLYVTVADPKAVGRERVISLAEVQLLQALVDARQGVFGEVVLQDIVSSETEAALAALWQKPSLLDPSKTYAELVASLGNVSRSARAFQNYIPTIDESGKISLNRTAPGGHALFALDALRAAYLDGARPKPKGKATAEVALLGNGEDMSSTPDGAMVGWMVAENVPIVMVTTDKTENDLKGGQIAMVKKSDGSVYATIIEQAQAKEAGQLALFEQLGLRKGDDVAFFNTNVALFNYSVLGPKLKKLVAEIGEAEFSRVVAPDLIQNKKTQVESDGVKRAYTQLEGAMGSSLLRLDRFWRERYGEPLVHFINVERESRTRFFSPVKTAFDFFMQFFSDRFELDERQMRLVNRRPGELPAVVLNDKTSDGKYWADVETVLQAFEGAKILDLDKLEVEGRVSFRGVTLKGEVKVVNRSDKEIDLGHMGTLENVSIELP